MTLEEIQASAAVLLRPEDVAGVLGANPQTIRDAARNQPERLGFPVCVLGKNIKIPRKPFLTFLGE